MKLKFAVSVGRGSEFENEDLNKDKYYAAISLVENGEVSRYGFFTSPCDTEAGADAAGQDVLQLILSTVKFVQ